MSTAITLSIVLSSIGVITSSYLEPEANYMPPILEKNNILNKGVWIKKTNDDEPVKTQSGAFVFRENSLDVDSLLQNNFDAFADNFMRESPMISSYIARNKRESKDVQSDKVISDQNVTKVTKRGFNDDKSINTFDRKLMKSKIIPTIKPPKAFNDYPYEIASLLAHNNKIDLEPSKSILNDEYQRKQYNNSKKLSNLSHGINKSIASKVNKENIMKFNHRASKQNNYNATSNNFTYITPKRRMSHDYESEIVKKIEFTEEINKTEDSYDTNKIDRNIFDNEDRAWHQTAPITDVSSYKILPKPEKNEEAKNNKPISEKGLIKVLSMLTKTFKKVVKQHNDIKQIHNKLSTINDEFMKNAAVLMTKFQDFDVKYLYLMKFNENLKELELKLQNREELFDNKEHELSKNLIEFENQQKKFLIQQKQFYNIQKLMLAQNEKLNLKQSLIAKTQNEISLRQNNFARILKKAKQIYIDNKDPIPNKLGTILSKSKGADSKINDVKEITTSTRTTTTTSTTTTQSPNTESVKINLFSVPSKGRLINNDKQLLKEKDDHSVDDLIYKYYFNNSYIDVLMKNKILSNSISTPDNYYTRNAKSKRNDNYSHGSTKLIPINDIANSIHQENTRHLRGKRWIKISHKNAKKTDKDKDASDANRNILGTANSNKSDLSHEIQTGKKIKSKNVEKDPYFTMARNFCKELGQNENEQMLHWCVEKALRRLRSIDMKLPSTATIAANKDITIKTEATTHHNIVPYKHLIAKELPIIKAITVASTVPSTKVDYESQSSTSAVTQDSINSNIFFPDNDELESNLKQYELKPDTEGNVYYEGSVHASGIK